MKNKSYGRKNRTGCGLTLACLILLVYCSAPLLAPHQVLGTDWKRIRETFESYLSDPSPLHGSELVLSLPKKKIAIDEMDPAYKELLMTLDLIFSSEDYGRFMARVQSGDKYAIEAAFMIFNFSDGGASESLMIILGDSLREQPQAFLQVAKKLEKMLSSSILLAPATMTRYEEDSDLEAHELQLRLKALRSVNETDLLTIRDAFIDEILRTLRVQLKSEALQSPVAPPVFRIFH